MWRDCTLSQFGFGFLAIFAILCFRIAICSFIGLERLLTFRLLALVVIRGILWPRHGAAFAVKPQGESGVVKLVEAL